MSNDEQIPAVAEVENAKLSDGTSTAGEVNVEKVNDDEQVPESNGKTEESTVNETADVEEEEKKNGATDENEQDEEKNVNHSAKRDIDQVDEADPTKNGHDQGAGEETDEAVVSTTSNKKAKVLHAEGDEEQGNGSTGTDPEENSSNAAKVPNEELTVV